MDAKHKQIAVTAYYLAEKDDFQGDPVVFWLAAEAQFESNQAKKTRYGLKDLHSPLKANAS